MSDLRLLRADDWRFRGEEQWIVSSMIKNVRPMDKEEWAAGHPHVSFDVALRATLACNPDQSWAVVDARHGHCLAMWGVSAGLSPVYGNAWMVCTHEAVQRVHAMHRFFKRGIADMHAIYPILLALAYNKNTIHHEWMERMGFKRIGGWRSFIQFSRGVT